MVDLVAITLSVTCAGPPAHTAGRGAPISSLDHQWADGSTAIVADVADGGSTLEFRPPTLVSGPECGPTNPQCQGTGGGPWWDKIHTLSDTHAIGWAEDHLIVTRDRGRTWQNFTFTDDCPACEGSLNTVAPARLPDGSAQGGGTVSFRNLGALNLTEGGSGNITGSASGGSIQFYLTEAGEFARRPAGRVNVTGLPDVRSLRYGSGGVIALADGTLVISTIAVLSTGPGYLSCIALRSTDGGYAWRFASVITAWAEVPYAHEGPSESSLAFLNNGSLLCIMRVEGQSGRYSPYITKLSDDGGLSWHSLRSISTGGSGGVGGAGCVRPRLLPLIAESGGRSLVLSGGRPNPLSRDVLLWLNAAGDGEAWEAFSVSYWHNRLVTNSSWLFPPAATNDSRTFPRLSTSYTSLVRTANNSGYVVYGMGIRSFAMGFQLTQG